MTDSTSGWIAAVIVNYGTAELAVAAVESVLSRHHGGRRIEVHLVDNASPGADAEVLRNAHSDRAWGDRVTLYLEQVNHGFGRGNNVVLQALAERDDPPAHVLLLNPDARLENEAIDILAGHLDDHPKTGAAGAGITLPDGTPVTAAFRFPSLPGQFEKAANFGPISRLMRQWCISLPPDISAGRVDWVAGAGVMLRFEALRQAKFFDPAFFLYFEEVDLMLRMTHAGWDIWFAPEARVIHVEGASTGVASSSGRKRRPAYVYDSWRHYFRKNHGRGIAVCAALAAMVGATLNVVTCRLRGQTPRLPHGYFRDMAGLVLVPLVTGASDGDTQGSTGAFGTGR